MSLLRYISSNKTALFIVLASFLLLEIIVAIGVYYMSEQDRKNYLEVETADFSKHLTMANSHLSDISSILYDAYVDNEAMIDIMYKASNTNDKEELARLRKNLYDMFEPAYQYMSKYKVRQFHFHLPGSISFLRFHKPDKYGDSLVGARESLSYVNDAKVPISCFEEGRIFNGFRNVFPIFKKNEFVGTVEISYSFSALQDELLKADSSSYLFLIRADRVDAKVFKEEKIHYKLSEFEGFDYDKATLKDTMQFRLSILHLINKEIATKVDDRMKNGEQFSLSVNLKDAYSNKKILISFVPIQNLNSDCVAYVIHYSFGTFLDVLLNKSKLIFIVLTLMIILIVSIFSYFLIHAKKQEKYMKELAIHDPLTGIYNRNGVNELINQKIEEFQRFNRDFSVIFFDIDYFKKINDTYGHDIGDYVLQNIAKLTSQSIRKSDIFARWGGEEFIIFLPETNINDAVAVAQKLRIDISQSAFYNIEQITCSFGVTQLNSDDTKEIMLKRVDTYLYKAKESGRNKVVSDLTS
jgi:diguanylate cyclase (GGDEF)-like protein